jgi:hypothetical protein
MARFHEYKDDLGRVCKICREYKLYSEFHKHSGCPKGFNTVCKLCRKPLSKKQYASKPHEYHIFSRAKTRAKERNLEFDIEISDITIPEKCPVFGTKFEIGNHKTCASIDRINANLGYVKGNIQIISNKANMIKGDASLEEIEKLYIWYKSSCEVN